MCPTGPAFDPRQIVRQEDDRTAGKADGRHSAPLIIGNHYSPTLRYGCRIVVIDDGSDEKYQLNLIKSVISTLF